MAKDDGGPAFPVEVYVGDNGPGDKQTSNYSFLARGLSMRDYFAAAAMQGSCANPQIIDTITDFTAAVLAKWAYAVADAMLEARNK
jgi:hypothetical protein